MPEKLLSHQDVSDLRALARVIIPPSATYGVPGADDDLIFSDICKSLDRDHDDVCRALADLRALSGGAFADLDAERRKQAANVLRDSDTSKR